MHGNKHVDMLSYLESPICFAKSGQSLLTYILPSTQVDKNYSTPIWSRVLALLGTALVSMLSFLL